MHVLQAFILRRRYHLERAVFSFLIARDTCALSGRFTGISVTSLPVDRDRFDARRHWRGESASEDNVGMGRCGVLLDINGTLVEPLRPQRLDEITLIAEVIRSA
jgi:hypothetical protein